MLLAGAIGLGIVTAQAQSRPAFPGENVTGVLKLQGTVNLMKQAQAGALAKTTAPLVRATIATPEVKPGRPAKQLRPPNWPQKLAQATTLQTAATKSLGIATTSQAFHFDGLTHFDQRQANNGNQFSIEPATPGIAVGEGMVLEGVQDALQVYTTSGAPLLPSVVTSNQFFGLPPAIDRTTGVNGVYLTDMRVFYDADIRRWIVLEWSQANDAAGNPLAQSTEWIAVSQTTDPTGTWNIYAMDTTDAKTFGCPCIPDYPQIGADKYGLYISSNEFDMFQDFITANITAISKASLSAGVKTPTMYRFVVPMVTGYEFAIQPATTPPGASYFIAANGLEYFISSVASSFGNSLALWAMTNTITLGTTQPAPVLTQITFPTLTYIAPDVAKQRPGPLPYGSTLVPPGLLAFLDGGDTRVLSLSYSGGRLYATLATTVIDENGHFLVGGAYFIVAPTFRGGNLSVFVLRQGFVQVRNNHLLRSVIGVNASGKGAITFTLAGPDYYPGSAFLPIDTFSTGSEVQIVKSGVAPEDGFSGYPNEGFPELGIARWGDNSAAAVDIDGSIWMATEYIPNAPRTQLANWGTSLSRWLP